ncbi:MAG: F0F1 ATP synthase subunit A [Acidimicrobiales bacterium]|nr:F0F1 ATP synthase subunit A [Acidimicrobiales bacterium]
MGVIATVNIPVGDHITRTIYGMTFNVDTIWTTALAGVIVITLGLVMRVKLTAGVPGGLQLFFESLVDFVEELVESSIGKRASRLVPLAVALFLFILTANWLSLIPSGFPKEYLPAPAADVNTTYALAVLVIIIVHGAGFRAKKLGYLKHFVNPLHLIEEITKPITLTLRLFGNLFAGGLMVALIGALLPVYLVWLVDFMWKVFDMFVGGIQAFIFALLTIVYFGLAAEKTHG